MSLDEYFLFLDEYWELFPDTDQRVKIEIPLPKL
jgi:hypothetical protein